MDPAQKVLLYLEISRQNPDSGLNEIAKALTQRGLSSSDAEVLIAFVPMGFGYVLLSSNGVKLSDTFQVFDSKTGARRRGQLIDQPIFQAAVETADQMFGDPGTTEQAYETARKSAEFSAATQLCPDGADLEKIVLTEAVLTRVPIDFLW